MAGCRQRHLFLAAVVATIADAFRGGGGEVEFRVLAAYGSEGHWLAETEEGVKSAAPELARALKARTPAVAKKR